MRTRLRITHGANPPRNAPAEIERREACRFHTVMRVAKVERARDVGLWRVRNISNEGMMLLSAMPLAPNEPLTIGLSDTVLLPARVVWWDGGRCGVAFDEPIDCGRLLSELVAGQKGPRYRPPRLPVSTRALLYSEKGLHTVQIDNISQHGAGLRHDGSVRAGMATKMLLPSGDEHRGVVRWARDGRAGLFLIEPLACAQLESANRI